MRGDGMDVSRADILQDNTGLVEYRNADDMERAVRKVCNVPIYVFVAENDPKIRFPLSTLAGWNGFQKPMGRWNDYGEGG